MIEFFIALLVVGIILKMIVNVDHLTAEQSNDICTKHTWRYKEGGGLRCEKCGLEPE
jgi:hypothetical protein